MWHLLVAQMQHERPLAQIGAGEVRHAILGAEALRLLAHVLDQLRPHDSVGKSGEILDQRRHRELAAGLVAFDAPAVSGWRARCKERQCVRSIRTR